MDPTEHAAHLRQTAALMEEAAQAVERVEELGRRLADCQSMLRALTAERDDLHMRVSRAEEWANVNALKNIHLTGTVGELKADLDRWKKTASEQQGFIAGHQRSVLRAEQNAVIAQRREAEAIEALEAVKRENETLARQVPPQLTEFTVKSLGTDGGRVAEVGPVLVSHVIGQAWCRVGNSISSSMVVMRSESHHATLILCNVHQDVTTGAVTYVPISFDDLPRVTEAAAP